LSEEVVEEIVPGEDLEPELTEGDDEGLGLPGLAAAGAAAVVAADLLDDEDTQPIAVADEPAHPGEPEPEEIAEEPVMETGEDLLEVEDDVEEQVLEPEGEIPPLGDIEEAEVPALAADAPLSGEEEDAAMAWLESLAAKQGASEEELLTPTDQRLDQPPEWVQEEASEAEPLQDEDIEARDTALTAAALAGVTAGMLAEHDETEDVDTAGEEGPETEDLLEEPSEWMPEVLEEQELVPGAESGEVDIESEPLEIEEPAGVVEQVSALAEADLEQAETEDIPEEIPDWLSGLAEEQEGTLETEADEWSPDMLAEEVEEPAAPIDAAPVEKIDLNAASLSQLERIPGIGFIFAQNIVSHRAESGSFTDLEQLGEVEGISAEMVADLSDYLTVEVVTEISPSESETPELQDAWNSIAEGNVEKGVDQYTDLIDQDQYLDEIIRDLQSAINKYPSDSALYQCLGDAYMHSNMLQEALDAYNRAEDLI
jgi:competence ComEA-like helix-hairpin-helix protein